MSKQTLDISQMQHLKELGVDTSKASMVLLYTDDEGEIIEWEDADEFPEKFIGLYDAETGNYDHSYRRYCGVFTLQDILDLLPSTIEFSGKYFRLALLPTSIGSKLYFSYIDGDYKPYINSIHEEENIIDAAYELLCWCIKRGFIETEKSLATRFRQIMQNTAVNCETEEDAKEFVSLVLKIGFIFNSEAEDKDATYWDEAKEETCYILQESNTVYYTEVSVERLIAGKEIITYKEFENRMNKNK